MTSDLESNIRERAYALWEQDGRRHGRAQEHWYRAERELAAFTAAAKVATSITPAKRRAPAKGAAAVAKTKRAAKAQVLHS